MQKTSVFTSLTMLLSVAHIGFAAESQQRLDELALQESESAAVSAAAEASQSAHLEEQARIAREIYAQIPTPGRTLYSAKRLILPGYPGCTKRSITDVKDNSLRMLAITGGLALDSPRIVAASTAGPVATVLATATSPAVGLTLMEAVTTYRRYQKHNTFTKRAGRNPVLSVYECALGDEIESILEIQEERGGDDKKTYFNMKTFEEYPEKIGAWGTPQLHLSIGGHAIKNENGEGIKDRPIRRGTPWQPTRKLHGNLLVTMDTPKEKNPAIQILRCSGACDEKYPGSETLTVECQNTCLDLIQECESPSKDVALRSFALSACGQYLAFGCTNGAVFILHRHDDIQTEGRPWTWYSALEQRLGKPITTYLNDHISRLQEARSPRLDDVESKQNAVAILPPSS